MSYGRLRIACAAAVGASMWVASPVAQQASLMSRLETVRAAAHLPAVGGAIFRSATTLDTAVVGVRRVGDPAAATAGDLWHIGSLTKSFTSALVATFVERGELSWTSTLGDLLGAERARKFAPVTLTQLLSHRAGLSANAPPLLTFALAQSSEPVTEQRRRLLETAFSGDPASAPGETFLYSNFGYIVMGAILESRTGRSWEDLVRTRVLAPLSLSSAGFGPPGTPDAVSQPRGHRPSPDGLVPVEPGPAADNPPFLGPAGALHMTIADLVRWGQAHLKGERGEDGLVRAATFRYLHQPPRPDADYALGWVVRRNNGRRILWHNGSNTMWYVILAFDPDADLGVVLVTNGGIAAARAIDTVAFQVLDNGSGITAPVH